MLTFGARAHVPRARRPPAGRTTSTRWSRRCWSPPGATAYDAWSSCSTPSDESPARRAWSGLRRGCREAGIDVRRGAAGGRAAVVPAAGRRRRIRELGVPYDVAAHPFAAQAVVDGRVTHASRDELAASARHRPGPGRRRSRRLVGRRRPRRPTLRPRALGRRARPPAHRRGHAAGRRRAGPAAPGADREAAPGRRVVVADPRRRGAARRLLARRGAARAAPTLVAGPAALLGLAAWQAGQRRAGVVRGRPVRRGRPGVQPRSPDLVGEPSSRRRAADAVVASVDLALGRRG